MHGGNNGEVVRLTWSIFFKVWLILYPFYTHRWQKYTKTPAVITLSKRNTNISYRDAPYPMMICPITAGDPLATYYSVSHFFSYVLRLRVLSFKFSRDLPTPDADPHGSRYQNMSCRPCLDYLDHHHIN